MEVTHRLLPQPSWTDGVIYFVGAVTTTIILIRILNQIYAHLRLYVLPRISRQKNYVSMYGKWAVITGGSDGIGKFYSMELAKRGMNICVISNFENNIVQNIKNKYNVDVKWIDIDFSSSEVYDQIKKELSLLDDIGILVNNVGMVNDGPQPLAEMDREFLMKILNVNLTTTMLMTEMVLKEMVRRDRGLIVNMCSATAKISIPYFTMYCSTKSFIENYTVCLASELSAMKSNVRVKCCEPWFVKTPLLKGLSKFTRVLDKLPLLNTTFVEAPKFAASATATFGFDTPLIYCGYWTQDLIDFLIPWSLLPKTVFAEICTWCMKSIEMI